MKRTILTIAASLVALYSLAQGINTSATDTAGNAVLFAGDTVSSLTNDAGYLTQIGTGEQATNSAVAVCTNAITVPGSTSTRITMTGTERLTAPNGWDYGGFIDTANDQFVFTSSGPGKYRVGAMVRFTGLNNGSVGVVDMFHVSAEGASTNSYGYAYNDGTADGFGTGPSCQFNTLIDITNANEIVYFEALQVQGSGVTLLANRTFLTIEKVSTPQPTTYPTNSCMGVCTSAISMSPSTSTRIPIEGTERISGPNGWDYGGFLDTVNDQLVFTNSGVGKYEIKAMTRAFTPSTDRLMLMSARHVSADGASTNSLAFDYRTASNANSGSSPQMSFDVSITNAAEVIYFELFHTDTSTRETTADSTFIWCKKISN